MEFVDLGLSVKWSNSSILTGNFEQASNCSPSKKDFDELIEKGRWEWDGNGFKVTGPNGNYVYINKGAYWSSTEKMDYFAYALLVSQDMYLVTPFEKHNKLYIKIVQ